jgi:glycosyltransferase involved in cell wall biosynthesis
MRLIFTVGTAGKSGGTDVLLDMIQFSKELGIDTLIHCLDMNTSSQWAARYPQVTQIDEQFITNQDILVASEEFVWAVPHLSRYTTRYIVLNQGLNASLVSDFKQNTYPVTKLIYQGAMGVIANSKHTRESIIELFELNPSKVHLYKIHIDEIFKPLKKSNIVSYMPRKNRAFGCFVVNYLCGKYTNVEFVAIDNMSRPEVAEVLGRSKIFLSFGGPEGFGMPPLEAALAGCKVIGFDGGGGEEFFNMPIFSKIPFYDHMEFIKVAERYVKSEAELNFEEQRLRLKDEYSMESARQSFYNALRTIGI